VKTVFAIGCTFLCTAAVAAGVIGFMISRGAFKKEDPVVVRLEKPSRGDLTEFISARAEVRPETRVSISARVSGRIEELPYEEGDAVTKGDPDADPPVPPSVLVRLDAADLEAALQSAEANRNAQAAQIEVEKERVAGQRAAIEGTRASLAQARLDLARQEELLRSRDVSQADVDSLRSRVAELASQLESSEHSANAAEQNLLVLQHRLTAADAGIAEARDRLADTTITSTIDGVVTRIQAEEGEMVIPGTMNNPGTVIMEVADLSTMLLIAEVDETDVTQIAVGQKAIATIHAYPDEEFEGTVQSIALKHDSGQGGSKYFKTEILLDLAGRQVYSGSTADVDIETQYHTDVMKVPSQAVLERIAEELPVEIREDNPSVDMDKTYATVVYRLIDGKAVVTPVTIGASDATHTVVLSGLEEDQDVVVGPYKVLESLAHDQEVKDEREVEKEDKDEGEAGDGPEVPAETGTEAAP
jgi:HlyD family secretion protein